MPIGKPTSGYTVDERYRDLPRALLGGTTAMREAGEKYLPPHPGERYLPVRGDNGEWAIREDLRSHGTAYGIRLRRSVLYPFYSRAVDKAVDAILARSIRLQDDVPQRLKGIWEDIDLRGNIGDVFLRDVLRDAIGEAGVSFVLVDHSPTGGKSSNADLTSADRAYWVHVKACDVLNPENWAIVDGVPRLIAVQVQESAAVGSKEDEFSSEIKPRIRVLRRATPPEQYATAQVYEKKKNPTDGQERWEPEGEPFPLIPHTEIPIAALYINKTENFRGRTPFEHLAHLCVCHWQKRSDLDMTLWRISPPIIHRSGASKQEVLDQVVLAAGVVMYSQNEDAKAEYVEHSGSSITTSQDDLKLLEARILAESMEPHVQRTQSETATGRQIDWEQAKTEIQAWGIVTKDFVEECLRLTGLYHGFDKPGSSGSVDLPASHRPDMRNVEMLKLASEIMKGLGLSAEQVLTEMQRAGMFSDDFDIPTAVASIQEGVF